MKNSVLLYLENTVKKFPDKVAFIDKDTAITFKELKQMALIVADDILKKNIGRNNPILVYLPKSTMSIVAFMGILYSGNFYTPTDIRFPIEKVKSVIFALNPKLVITSSTVLEKLSETNIAEESFILTDNI